MGGAFPGALGVALQPVTCGADVQTGLRTARVLQRKRERVDGGGKRNGRIAGKLDAQGRGAVRGQFLDHRGGQTAARGFAIPRFAFLFRLDFGVVRVNETALDMQRPVMGELRRAPARALSASVKQGSARSVGSAPSSLCSSSHCGQMRW